MKDICVFNYMKKKNWDGEKNRQNKTLYLSCKHEKLAKLNSFYTPYNRWQHTSFVLLFTIILNRGSGTSVTSHKIRVE